MRPNSEASLAGLSILLVDANAEHRGIARLQLEACGARVREAATPDDALASLAAGGSDAMVTELHFGERDVVDGCGVPSPREGIELVRVAHARHRVPIAVLTTLALPATRTEAVSAGCDEFVSKPYPLRQLRDALLRAVSRARSRG